MKLTNIPDPIRDQITPKPGGNLVYRCLSCNEAFGIHKLLYTCPACGHVLLIYDEAFDRLKQIPAAQWHEIFDYRKMLCHSSLKGIFRYQEFIAPVIPMDAVVYLGEGNTPVVEGNDFLKKKAGIRFFFKNEGQNPSASFKDRGMASAFSYIHYLLQTEKISDVIAVCASTGDTSAAAALYASYLFPRVKSAVLLPHKKVTPQQLSQPLGSGATVFEIPGVFDDCMKVVEALADNYTVALLNSKNAWRVLGQESYAYEIAQDFEYEMADKVVVVPVGNAGNITAVMNGFLKFHEIGIIDALPKIVGVQSHHANPVYRYYLESDKTKRRFAPVTVKPSVAQAAMIGNPVSMPRVIHLVDRYNEVAGQERVFFVQVTEQDIMDWELLANRNGHIACPHGGESLALDSTAHALKFIGFQDMYFKKTMPSEFKIEPNPDLINSPIYIHPKDLKKVPSPGDPITGEAFDRFVRRVSEEIASLMNLKKA